MSPYVDHDPKSKGFDYTDASELERLYHDKGLSTTEMADKAGVTADTIVYHMDKHDIPRRDRIEATKKSRRVERAGFFTDVYDGYEKWISTNNKMRVHRLLAVAEYGYDAVCGMDVHHKNGVPWDNRPENIELMTHGKHTEHHNNGIGKPKKLDEESVRKIRQNSNCEVSKLASKHGVSKRTIYQVINRDTWSWVPDS